MWKYPYEKVTLSKLSPLPPRRGKILFQIVAHQIGFDAYPFHCLPESLRQPQYLSLKDTALF